MAVLDHIGDPGRGVPIVFKHEKFAGRITNDIRTADMDVSTTRRIVADHRRLIIRIPENKIGWQDAVFQYLPLVIDIPNKQLSALMCCFIPRSSLRQSGAVITRGMTSKGRMRSIVVLSL